jgi:hypothetical protein
VFALALSLIVPAQNFAVRASKFRDCYLAMYEIYRSTCSPQDKEEAYQRLLRQHENHADADWDRVLVEAKLYGRKLENRSGEIAVPEWLVLKSRLKSLAQLTLLGLAFVWPVVLGYLLTTPKVG